MDFTFAEREAVSCTVSCKGGRIQGANPCPQLFYAEVTLNGKGTVC